MGGFWARSSAATAPNNNFFQKHPKLGKLKSISGRPSAPDKRLNERWGSEVAPGLLLRLSKADATFMNMLPPTEQNNGGHDLATDVRKFVLKSFPLARKQQIKDSDALLESGMIDSQGVLEVVDFIERQFSTTVEDEELVPENFQTIDRIVTFIRTKTSHQNPGRA